MCLADLTLITSRDQLPGLGHALLLCSHPNNVTLEAYVIWTFEVT